MTASPTNSVNSPFLLIINGMPGTGKTTLAAKLAKDIDYPFLGKDMLKEFLFEHLGVGDKNWSRVVGGATFHMLYVLIDTFLTAGKSIIIECPFYAEYARPEIKKSVQRSNMRCLEVYCTTDPEVRRTRFVERAKSGLRHPGHADVSFSRETSEDELNKTYAPLAIGKVIKLDTTNFGDDEYGRLLTDINDWLRG